MMEGEEFSHGRLATLTHPQPFLTQNFCVPAFLRHCPLEKAVWLLGHLLFHWLGTKAP